LPTPLGAPSSLTTMPPIPADAQGTRLKQAGTRFGSGCRAGRRGRWLC
jgi:hypothetical protein